MDSDENATPPVPAGEPDRWKRDEFRVLDDSFANMLIQMLLAMAGMFVAFVIADWVNTRWFSGDGATAYLARGLTFCLFGSLSIYVTSARPIRQALLAEADAITAHEATLQAQAERHRLVGRLQSAFDMAESDHDAFVVVGEALATVADVPAEMLLADSSRAHLRRVAVASGHGGPSCGVETPWGCPAVRKSRTLAFGDSRELDACPRLKDRPGGPCSALCVPVTVLGTPMGVLHLTGTVGDAPDGHTRDGLEALAEHAGSRIGILRAMAASELQATTDPLTGLLNRRSLEAELSRLRDRETSYAIAFLDLDHFKDLNDTYGHETGDRALRAFARLLRQSVRDTDLVCRYGGEEFVVVFPGSTMEETEALIGRVSRSLAEAVLGGDVPSFTISVGIAEATLASDAAEVIRSADEAMFMAKEAGRNRIVLAEAAVAGSDGGDLPEVVTADGVWAFPTAAG